MLRRAVSGRRRRPSHRHHGWVWARAVQKAERVVGRPMTRIERRVVSTSFKNVELKDGLFQTYILPFSKRNLRAPSHLHRGIARARTRRRRRTHLRRRRAPRVGLVEGLRGGPHRATVVGVICKLSARF